MLPSPAPASTARFGPYAFELRTGQLTKHGIRMKLQPQPAQVLGLLIRNRGEVVTRETIRSEVWGDSTFVDFENGLNKAVMKIREVLNDSAERPQYVETLPKVGYRFVAEVEYGPVVVGGRGKTVSIAASGLEEVPRPVVVEAVGEKKSRRAVLLAGTAVAGAAGLGYWAGMGREKIPGPVYLTLALPPGLSFVDVGFQGSPVAFSPDGTEVVVAAREGGKVRLYRRKLSDPKFEAVAGSEQARSPVYSEDGKYLLFVSPRERRLKRIPVEGGVAEELHGVRITYFGVQQTEDGRLWFGECGTGLVCRRKDGTTEKVTDTVSHRNEHGLLDNEHAYPEVLPGGRKVIYTAWTSGEASGLQLADLDKRTRGPLVRPGVTAKYLPRVGQLVYAWSGDLYAVGFDPDGGLKGKPRRVLQGVAQDISTGATFYAASGNGSLAYIAGRPQRAVGPRVWVNLKGEIDQGEKLPYFLNNSRISADGERICYNEVASNAGGNSIWVYEVRTGRRYRVTAEQTYAMLPIWTADGKSVIFQSRDGRTGPGALYRMNLDGGGEMRALTSGAYMDAPGEVTRDGRWLVYVSTIRVEGKPHVRVLDLEKPEAGSRPLVAGKGEVEGVQPSISPDGRWVAMVSNELSKEKNVVMRALEEPQRVYKVSEGGGWQPVWAPDGKQVYYFDGSGRKMMAASVEFAGGAPRIGAPRELFRGPFFPWYGTSRIWDVHPDGTRLLGVTAAAQEPRKPMVEIVLNWDGTLRG